MKHAELWASYNNYTLDLSKLTRQLAFAAAALCWFFRTPRTTFPPHIYVALTFVVAFFIADILQYFSGAWLVRIWTRKEEVRRWQEGQNIEGDYDKPWWLDVPPFVLFNVKIIALLAAFGFLGAELLRRQ